MSPRCTKKNYHAISRWLHWLMALFIISMLAGGFLMGELPLALRPLLVQLHATCGLCLLALAVLRLMWRIYCVPPALPQALPPILAHLSALGHWALYALMVAMPLSGWLMISAASKQILFAGAGQIPWLMGADRVLAAQLREWHETLAYGLLAMLLAHVAAAMYHHFIRKDEVLMRMLGRVS